MIIPIVSLLTLFAVQPDALDLNRQGRDLLDQHRYSAARRVLQQAADNAQADFGPRDPATAMILRNLALAQIESGDPAAAERTARLALSIFESRFGKADAGLVPILNVLAESYVSLGRLGDAQCAEQRAVSIGSAAGTHFGIALHNLGAIREMSGDRADAECLYQRAIAVKIETLGASHPYVLLSKEALHRVQRQDQFAMDRPHMIRLEHGE